MRIAYLLTSLGVGGAERQAISLAERMAARGHAVALLVLRDSQPEQWPTTLDPVHFNMSRTPASLLAGLWEARRFLRDFHPDLIHSHTYPANMMARLLKILHPATAVLSTVHNVYEGSWPRMLAYRLTDLLSCHTTAVSQAAAVAHLSCSMVSQSKLLVLPNGVDGNVWRPDPPVRKAARLELGLQREFLWLAAGRLEPVKDYPTLLAAMAQVPEPPAEELVAVADAGGALLALPRLVQAGYGSSGSC